MKLDERLKMIEPMELNSNLMSVYDYHGYTIQEILNVFFTKIVECLEKVNETLDLVEWLVNEGLKEEVARKLGEWLIDGTLAEIINEVIFKELNDKIDSLKITVDGVVLDLSNLKTKVDEIDTKVDNNTNKISDLDTKIKNRVSLVSDFGAKGDGITDDYQAIKNAVDFLKDKPFSKLVFDKDKTYLVNSGIEIEKGDLIIEGNGATLTTTNPNIGTFFTNGKMGATYNGYDGNGNITIRNLNFLGYQDKTYTCLALGHARNIIVEKCTFKNIYSHCMDVAGVDGLIVRDCAFIGHTGINNMHQECIQLDYNNDVGFSLFGAFDDTVTRNVTIERCRFEKSENYKAWGKCIGGHTYIEDRPFDGLTVRDCYMESEECAIGFNNTFIMNLLVENNVFVSKDECVYVLTPPNEWQHKKNILTNININNNFVKSSNSFLTIKSDFHDVSNVNIINNLINHNKSAIQVRDTNEGWGESSIANILIQGNKCYGKIGNSNGVYFDQVKRSSILDNLFTDNDLDTILINKSHTIRISNNNIHRCKRYGITATDTESLFINSNKIVDMKTYAMLIGYSNTFNTSDVVICDNVLRKIGSYEGVSGVKRPIGLFKCVSPIINNNSIINTDSDVALLPDTYIYVDVDSTEPIVANNIIKGNVSGSNEKIIVASTSKHLQNNFII